MDEFQKNKKFLKRYKPYKRNIDRLKERVNDLNVKMENLKSPQISDMPKGSPKQRDFTEEMTMKAELKKRIDNLKIEGQPIKDEICSIIDHLANPHQAAVLELYFIDDFKFEQIAKKLNYSNRQVARLYGSGVMSLTGHYDDINMT